MKALPSMLICDCWTNWEQMQHLGLREICESERGREVFDLHKQNERSSTSTSTDDSGAPSDGETA